MGRKKRAALETDIQEKRAKLDEARKGKQDLEREINGLEDNIETLEDRLKVSPYDDFLMWMEDRPGKQFKFLAQWIRANIPLKVITIKGDIEIQYVSMRSVPNDLEVEGSSDVWEIAKMDVPGIEEDGYSFYITLVTQNEEAKPTWTI